MIKITLEQVMIDMKKNNNKMKTMRLLNNMRMINMRSYLISSIMIMNDRSIDIKNQESHQNN